MHSIKNNWLHLFWVEDKRGCNMFCFEFPSSPNRFTAMTLCPTIMSTKINKSITTYPFWIYRAAWLLTTICQWWSGDQNNVKCSFKLSMAFWTSRTLQGTSHTRLVSFHFRCILWCTDLQFVLTGIQWGGEKTTLTLFQEFTSHLQYEWHLKLIVHGGVEGGKCFPYKWNALRSQCTLHEQYRWKKTIFYAEGEWNTAALIGKIIEKKGGSPSILIIKTVRIVSLWFPGMSAITSKQMEANIKHKREYDLKRCWH